ncbi:DNA-directed RNA polymerases I, II, and III subunit RPABC3 [Cyclospora cayetanensis]|nr:DNA-directed RNA polymerases I, II, and III subunit RPABC3 [Cyclospora cayetanensis]
MSIPCLFEDRFTVRSVDNNKFERVSRIRAKSSGLDAELILDVNKQLLPLAEKQGVHIGLTNSLVLPDRKADGSTDAQQLSGYDYVMYGKVFKLEETSSERRTLYLSFGGLLMSLAADKHVVGDLELDMRVYLLVKRSQESLVEC